MELDWSAQVPSVAVDLHVQTHIEKWYEEVWSDIRGKTATSYDLKFTSAWAQAQVDELFRKFGPDKVSVSRHIAGLLFKRSFRKDLSKVRRSAFKVAVSGRLSLWQAEWDALLAGGLTIDAYIQGIEAPSFTEAAEAELTVLMVVCKSSREVTVKWLWLVLKDLCSKKRAVGGAPRKRAQPRNPVAAAAGSNADGKSSGGERESESSDSESSALDVDDGSSDDDDYNDVPGQSDSEVSSVDDRSDEHGSDPLSVLLRSSYLIVQAFAQAKLPDPDFDKFPKGPKNKAQGAVFLIEYQPALDFDEFPVFRDQYIANNPSSSKSSRSSASIIGIARDPPAPARRPISSVLEGSELANAEDSRRAHITAQQSVSFSHVVTERAVVSGKRNRVMSNQGVASIASVQANRQRQRR